MNFDSPRLRLAVASGLAAGSYFGMSKYVAIHAGVDGLAVLGVIASASNLFALLADLNIGSEMTKRIALLKVADQDEDVPSLVGTVFYSTFFGSVVLLILCIALSPIIGDLFGVSSELVLYGGVCGTATIFSKQFFNTLSGLGHLSLLAITGATRALVVTMVVIATIRLTSIEIVEAYTAAMVAGLAVTAILSSFSFKLRLKNFNFEHWSSLARVGAVTTLALMANQGVWFILPSLIWIMSGSLIAGYFSAAFLIASALQQIWSSLLSHEFFPRIAVSHPDTVSQAIWDEVRIHFAVTVLPSLTVVLFQKPILELLFTNDLREATSLLPWVLVGFLSKVVTNIMSLVLYARKSVIYLLVLEAISGCLLLSTIVIGLTSSTSTAAPGVAFAASHMLIGLIALFIANKKLGLSRTVSLGGRVIAYSTLVLAVAWISERSMFIGVLTASPIIIVEVIAIVGRAGFSRSPRHSNTGPSTDLDTSVSGNTSEIQ